MLLSEPLGSLLTFFRTSLIKFYLNSQPMSDSFYYITESSDLKEKKISSKNTLIRVEIHRYSALTYDVI